MAETNKEKKKHGDSAKNAVQEILDQCIKNKYITSYESTYRLGRVGYKDKQFYAPYAIHFSDKSTWIIFSTTSLKDRIKEQQWDSYNLKEINSHISYSILTYPDSIDADELKKFKSKRLKIINAIEYSALDDIISHKELLSKIEAKALADETNGVRKNKEGKAFENYVAAVLRNVDNLKRWQDGDNQLTGLNFDLYCNILDCFGIEKGTVAAITTTTNIPLLPSGGQPKTDVLINIIYKNLTAMYFTISCKRSSADFVSIHQYPADSFADVMNPEDEKLRFLLNDFQQAGSVSALGKEKTDALTQRIKLYEAELVAWALGGIGGLGNPKTQWARYIMTWKNENEDIHIYDLATYCEMLYESDIKGQFGTPFQWTYASKSKGKSIQLKSKVL